MVPQPRDRPLSSLRVGQLGEPSSCAINVAQSQPAKRLPGGKPSGAVRGNIFPPPKIQMSPPGRRTSSWRASKLRLPDPRVSICAGFGELAARHSVNSGLVGRTSDSTGPIRHAGSPGRSDKTIKGALQLLFLATPTGRSRLASRQVARLCLRAGRRQTLRLCNEW